MRPYLYTCSFLSPEIGAFSKLSCVVLYLPKLLIFADLSFNFCSYPSIPVLFWAVYVVLACVPLGDKMPEMHRLSEGKVYFGDWFQVSLALLTSGLW